MGLAAVQMLATICDVLHGAADEIRVVCMYAKKAVEGQADAIAAVTQLSNKAWAWTVELDAFHSSKAAASALAWSVYHWLMGESMPTALGNVGVRRVTVSMLPIQTNYANPDVYRYTFNVTIHTHDRRI